LKHYSLKQHFNNLHLELPFGKTGQQTSMKWRIFGYLLGFVLIMIVILWFFQIVYLDDFYKSIKTNQIEEAAQSIEDNIDNQDISMLINRIAQRYDSCVSVLNIDGQQLYSAHILGDCLIHNMSWADYSDFYAEAKKNGGNVVKIFSRSSFANDDYNPLGFLGHVPSKDKGLTESMVYASIIKNNDGDTLLVLLNSSISPVDATVATLRVQLIYITIIIVGIALLLSFLISRRLSQPISKINASAKELAAGNFDVTFKGNDYKEISELSDTLNYAARELSRTEKLQRELIANISHDLRTPLTMIGGYSEAMRDLPGEYNAENAQVIIDEVNRLAVLVNDMLNLSKLEAGVIELKRKCYNLTASIEELVETYTKLTEQQDFTITFSADQKVFVEADAIKISQVLANLLNNAINYSSDNKNIIVRQTVIDNCVRIEVIDQGEGIEADKLPNIWQRYYKVDKEHRRASIGSGIGLSIVKNILELHQATFGVESMVGQGSTFWFELPIIDPPQDG